MVLSNKTKEDINNTRLSTMIIIGTSGERISGTNSTSSRLVVLVVSEVSKARRWAGLVLSKKRQADRSQSGGGGGAPQLDMRGMGGSI